MASSASFANVVEIEHEDYYLEFVVSPKMTDYCNLFPIEYPGFTLASVLNTSVSKQKSLLYSSVENIVAPHTLCFEESGHQKRDQSLENKFLKSKCTRKSIFLFKT